MVFRVPRRIASRWANHLKLQWEKVDFNYSLFKVLKILNVTSQEFEKCWRFVDDSATEDEIFGLLKEAGFGVRSGAISPRINFVRKVLQRYKEAKVFVCVCVCVCVYGLLVVVITHCCVSFFFVIVEI